MGWIIPAHPIQSWLTSLREEQELSTGIWEMPLSKFYAPENLNSYLACKRAIHIFWMQVLKRGAKIIIYLFYVLCRASSMEFKVPQRWWGQRGGPERLKAKTKYRIKLYLDWEGSGALEKLILQEIPSATFCGKQRFMPYPSFPDTPMVGTLLGRNPDQTLVTHSRPRAARTCGQPAANAMESAPEITPILKEFPLCKKIHMCQGYKWLPHKQTLDVENLLWEE